MRADRSVQVLHRRTVLACFSVPVPSHQLPEHDQPFPVHDLERLRRGWDLHEHHDGMPPMRVPQLQVPAAAPTGLHPGSRQLRRGRALSDGRDLCAPLLRRRLRLRRRLALPPFWCAFRRAPVRADSLQRRLDLRRKQPVHRPRGPEQPRLHDRQLHEGRRLRLRLLRERLLREQPRLLFVSAPVSSPAGAPQLCCVSRNTDWQ